MRVGLGNVDRFRWVGLMSAGARDTMDLDTMFAPLAANPGRTNQQLKLLYISCGKSDRLLAFSQRFDHWLTARGIHHQFHEMEGTHEWKVWRHSLAELLPMLF